jgi:DnaK suppressor protein
MAAAKKPAKKAAKPVAKKTAPKKAVAKKIAPKPAAKKPAVKAKAPAKSSARPAPSTKAAAVKKAPAMTEKKSVSAASKAASARPARNEKPARVPMAAPMSAAAAPVATAGAAPKAVPAPSPKDLAAAHEYLLARSATRSEAPVMVNGKRLPTEGELLKMADSDYMNEQQLAFFKHRLQQMERELLQNADETTEHLRETVIVPDPADRATIEEEHALELRTRDRERKLLKKVQQALTRIESGEYGYCEETGDPIGIPRLLARPTATLSLEAQQRRELKQKMYGD